MTLKKVLPMRFGRAFRWEQVHYVAEHGDDGHKQKYLEAMLGKTGTILSEEEMKAVLPKASPKLRAMTKDTTFAEAVMELRQCCKDRPIPVYFCGLSDHVNVADRTVLSMRSRGTIDLELSLPLVDLVCVGSGAEPEIALKQFAWNDERDFRGKTGVYLQMPDEIVDGATIGTDDRDPISLSQQFSGEIGDWPEDKRFGMEYYFEVHMVPDDGCGEANNLQRVGNLYGGTPFIWMHGQTWCPPQTSKEEEQEFKKWALARLRSIVFRYWLYDCKILSRAEFAQVASDYVQGTKACMEAERDELDFIYTYMQHDPIVTNQKLEDGLKLEQEEKKKKRKAANGAKREKKRARTV